MSCKKLKTVVWTDVAKDGKKTVAKITEYDVLAKIVAGNNIFDNKNEQSVEEEFHEKSVDKNEIINELVDKIDISEVVSDSNAH